MMELDEWVLGFTKYKFGVKLKTPFILSIAGNILQIVVRLSGGVQLLGKHTLTMLM